MIGVADARDAATATPRSVSLYGESLRRPLAAPRGSGRPRRCWSSTCRTSAPATTRSSGRRCSRCAPARARACACSCSTGPTLSAATSTPIEGRRQPREYCSFVGLEPVPVRHGLTLGEIVAWRADVEGVPPERVRDRSASTGLERDEHAHGVGPAVRAAVAEHAHVRHRARLPRRLPHRGHQPLRGPRDDPALRDRRRAVDRRRAPGRRLTAALPGMLRARAHVPPDVPQARRTVCGGVQIHVTDRPPSGRCAAYLALVTLAGRKEPERFAFRTEKYEFRDDVPAFDLLTGDAEARERIVRGDPPRAVAGPWPRSMTPTARSCSRRWKPAARASSDSSDRPEPNNSAAHRNPRTRALAPS